ncbi:Sulfatase [Giardia muris]|uniref:Sulfatase n=1 Tax=Giardia muris TaxID=5742 RepID=A0A4Z1TBS5_GIAMU|nr:Sulfatase [Giardia muris]|eukprot:TNJ30697.1 Sulfatase [Giardia muris]
MKLRRLPILPGYYIIPLLTFVIVSIMQLMRFCGRNTTGLPIVGDKVTVLGAMLITLTELAFLSVLSRLLHLLLCEKLAVPPIVPNGLLVGVCVGIFVITVLDLEVSREYQSIATLSLLKVYIFRQAPKYEYPKSMIVGDSLSLSDNKEIIASTIRENALHWGVLIGSICALLIVILVLVGIYWDVFVLSLFSRRHISRSKAISNGNLVVAASLRKPRPIGLTPDIPKSNDSEVVFVEQTSSEPVIEESILGIAGPAKLGIWVERSVVRSPIFWSLVALSVCYLAIFFIAIFGTAVVPTGLDATLPATLNFLKYLGPYTHGLYTTDDDYLTAIELSRQYTTLPEGRCWLDQRPVPEYPLLHADFSTCCAYNDRVSGVDCDAVQRSASVSNARANNPRPNVVILIWESLNLIPAFLDGEKFRGTDLIMNTQGILNEEYLPNLQKFINTGVTFFSSASVGLPTVSGWHGIMTGISPSSHGMNMVLLTDIDVDGLPEMYTREGYSSFYVSPSDFDFDGKRSWVLRPNWFDEIVFYSPTRAQAEDLGLDYTTIRKDLSWYADRVTTRQFQRQMNITTARGKPTLGILMNVDTHTPFFGYDKPEFYTNNISAREDPDDFVKALLDDPFLSRYTTVLSYADEYFIGETINFIQRNYPETIVVVLGDHGPRKELTSRRVKDVIASSWAFDESCRDDPYGDDCFFTTTAYINYFGTDSEVNRRIDRWRGKGYLGPVSHVEVLELAYSLAIPEHRLPTYKLYRDLFEVMENVTVGNPLVPWHTVSAVMLGIEMRTETSVFRSNIFGPKRARIYPNFRFPSCATPTMPAKPTETMETKLSDESSPRAMDMDVQSRYRDALHILRLHNYLAETGGLYNAAFEDSACVEVGACSFPKRVPQPQSVSLFVIMFVCDLLIGLGMGAILSGVAYLSHYTRIWKWNRAKLRLIDEVEPCDRGSSGA